LPAVEPTLTIAPPPAARSAGTAACRSVSAESDRLGPGLGLLERRERAGARNADTTAVPFLNGGPLGLALTVTVND